MKKYKKPSLVKAARLQALTAQQASSQSVDNGNSQGGDIV